MVEVAKRFGLDEELTENLTISDMQKKVWGYMGGEKLVPWEELQEKKYWIYNTAEDWRNRDKWNLYEEKI